MIQEEIPRQELNPEQNPRIFIGKPADFKNTECKSFFSNIADIIKRGVEGVEKTQSLQSLF